MLSSHAPSEPAPDVRKSESTQQLGYWDLGNNACIVVQVFWEYMIIGHLDPEGVKTCRRNPECKNVLPKVSGYSIFGTQTGSYIGILGPP